MYILQIMQILIVIVELKCFIRMLIDPALTECASCENTAPIGFPGLQQTVLVLEQGWCCTKLVAFLGWIKTVHSLQDLVSQQISGIKSNQFLQTYAIAKGKSECRQCRPIYNVQNHFWSLRKSRNVHTFCFFLVNLKWQMLFSQDHNLFFTLCWNTWLGMYSVLHGWVWTFIF